MFDDLYNRRGIVSLQPPVTIGQRAVDQGDALLLPGWQALDVQPLVGNLQGALRNIQAHDLLESLIL